MPSTTVTLIPWLPALGAVLCGLCCTRRGLRGLAAPICVLSIFAAFCLSFGLRGAVADGGGATGTAFEWIHIGGLRVDFAYRVDSLALLMLFVVTGIGTLVAIYAAGYMRGQRGVARFFAAVSLFIFAMTTLVMADNLVLLYLGWEGVGLCSYLLIGYDYQRPAAVAAAKKAFIVNRVGDLGFALGIFLTYTTFGTLDIARVIDAAATMDASAVTAAHKWIPFALMLGAFGKSAQLPLHVWLPDAMEGPTPVSALIHAATMVTAGVYMISRLTAVFALSPLALPVVATVGAFTALFAATIATCQNDLKRVFAYSTISQLGYMFLGVGALSAVGGMFHLFTHAFFKALLFLTAGNVMHALAGQLDMRHISGLRHKMPITCWLMFAGCIALAGVPFVAAGFYSKDMIIAAALEKGLAHNGWFIVLATIAIITAFLTAYYTFRLWFRVFLGPEQIEMGEDHATEAHTATESDIQVEHHHEAHEMGWLMNGPLLVLAIGSIIAGFTWGGWVERMVAASSPTHAAEAGHSTIAGMSTHTFMVLISVVVSLGGICVAAWFHWLNRDAAQRVRNGAAGLVRLLAGKYHVDEIYDAMIVRPLRIAADLFYVADRLIIDGLVALVSFIPRVVGLAVQPAQRGVLQGYGLGMAAGIALLVLLVVLALD